MIDAGSLEETREWITLFNFSKIEIFGGFLLLLFAWRLPTILEHRREMRKIEYETKKKSIALQSKITEARKSKGGEIKGE